VRIVARSAAGTSPGSITTVLPITGASPVLTSWLELPDGQVIFMRKGAPTAASAVAAAILRSRRRAFLLRLRAARRRARADALARLSASASRAKAARAALAAARAVRLAAVLAGLSSAAAAALHLPSSLA
jgi:hypothetical protein